MPSYAFLESINTLATFVFALWSLGGVAFPFKSISLFVATMACVSMLSSRFLIYAQTPQYQVGIIADWCIGVAALIIGLYFSSLFQRGNRGKKSLRLFNLILWLAVVYLSHYKPINII